MLVSQPRGKSAAWGTFQEAELHKKRLVDVHDGIGVFADGSGDGIQSDRASIEFIDDSA